MGGVQRSRHKLLVLVFHRTEEAPPAYGLPVFGASAQLWLEGLVNLCISVAMGLSSCIVCNVLS